MNLINFEPYTKSDENWKILSDFREVDHAKTYSIIKNMLKNIEKLLPGQFTGKLTVNDEISSYLGEKGSYFENLKIELKAGEYEKEINLKYPMLMQKNYFLINGSTYIPTIFLERSPIDILPDPKKGNKYFINLLPTFNITFNIKQNEILIRRKILDLNIFLKGLFQDDDYYKELVESGAIPEVDSEISDSEITDQIIKLLGFHDSNYFKANDLSISDFFDTYIILDYFKGMFKDMFDIDNMKDIVKLVMSYHINNTSINMSDINHRRVVMNEYIINPVYEMYIRLLFGGIDKNERQAFLPSMNSRVILTSGFQKLLHGGVYFNTSLPYTNPIINKISQDIYIINDGRIPKSWGANHPNSIGKICPISVSAQQMGKNLVLTNDTRINYYGRIEQ